MKWLGIRSELSEEYMEEVENKLGVSLPIDYKTAVLKIHCGVPEKNNIYVENIGKCLYGRNLALVKERKGNIFVMFQIMKNRKKKLIPFASVGNGDYFCFDIENDNKVVYWCHEKDTSYFVCNTFRELIKSLQ